MRYNTPSPKINGQPISKKAANYLVDLLTCEVYFVGVSIRFAFVNFKSEIRVSVFSAADINKTSWR